MRILLSAASFDRATGGPAHSVPALGAALAARGADIGLWAPDGTVAPDAAGCTALTGGFDQALASFAPDLIHDNGIWLPHHHRIAGLAHRRGIPRVVSPRGMLEPWALRQRRLKKKLAWLLYQRRDLLHAALLHATAAAEQQSIAALGLRRPVCVIPNGVALPAPAPPRARPPGGARTALFLSRIHPKKGLPMLLRAWHAVRPRGWRLVIAGPDEEGHEAEVAALAATLGLAAEVEIRGPAYGADKERLMRGCDLFVLPTFSENFGGVVTEALSYGVPVLTTTGAPWALLAEQDCGWWVAPQADAIAGALAEATAAPDSRREAMGRRGAGLVAGHFGWAGIAAKIETQYRSLLEQAPIAAGNSGYSSPPGGRGNNK